MRWHIWLGIVIWFAFSAVLIKDPHVLLLVALAPAYSLILIQLEKDDAVHEAAQEEKHEQGTYGFRHEYPRRH